MNATYIAIGALFIVLGVGAMARAKSAAATVDTPTAAKGARLSGILFIIAGLIFMITGAIGDRGA